MTRRDLAILASATAITVGAAACTPTVRLQVEPIHIYAKLDLDVRVRLDEELRRFYEQNPDLF
ncbi:MAG: YnbE family lipoprotein [Brevundimonas sp.]|jgi:hypothetical protein|uniref:YnbE family lipoprotein n=1 Tax=Brevundimonas sp. TaxID=1871086 RepID=UPI00391B1E99